MSLCIKQLGIRHQRTTPGCPWQNGRIERLFGTLKNKLDQLVYFPLPPACVVGASAPYPHRRQELLRGNHGVLLAGDAGEGLRVRDWIRDGVREQLNADLTIFQHWYNHVRPHQNLDGRTPAEAWRGINPYAKAPKQEHWFEAWDGLLTGYHLRY